MKISPTLAIAALLLAASPGTDPVNKLSSASALTPALAGPEAPVLIEFGHNSEVKALAWSPDGRYAASGDNIGFIKLWDTASGRPLRTIQTEDDFLKSLAISRDSARLLVAGQHALSLYAAATGTRLVNFVGGSGPALLSADEGTVIGRLSETELGIWKLSGGKAIRKLGSETQPIYDPVSLALSPDNKRLLVNTSSKAVWLWDLVTGKQIRQIDKGFGSEMAIFSQDGRSILSAGSNGDLKRYDALTGALQVTQVHRPAKPFDSTRLNSLALAGDGKSLLSCGLELRRLNPLSLETQKAYGEQSGCINAAYSPDRRRILVSQFYQDLVLRDADTGKTLQRFFSTPRSLHSAVFGSDGKLAVAASADGISSSLLDQWDLSSGTLQRSQRFETPARPVLELAPDGRQALTGGKELILWDLVKGLPKRKRADTAYNFDTLALSPDGGLALAGPSDFASDDTILDTELLDLASGKSLPSLPIGITAARFAADGKSLYLSASNQGLWEYRLADQKRLRSFFGRDYATLLSLSPDGRELLSYGIERGLELWDLASGKRLRQYTIDPIHSNGSNLNSIGFSADGKRIIGSSGIQIAIWDKALSRQIQTLKGHEYVVLNAAFSSDGRRVLSGSNEGSLRIWDLASGRELAQLVHFSQDDWACVTSQGYFTASSPQAIAKLSLRRGLRTWAMEPYTAHYQRPDLVKKILAGEAVPTAPWPAGLK